MSFSSRFPQHVFFNTNSGLTLAVVGSLVDVAVSLAVGLRKVVGQKSSMGWRRVKRMGRPSLPPSGNTCLSSRRPLLIGHA